jgi:hypothetical protein
MPVSHVGKVRFFQNRDAPKALKNLVGTPCMAVIFSFVYRIKAVAAGNTQSAPLLSRGLPMPSWQYQAKQ